MHSPNAKCPKIVETKYKNTNISSKTNRLMYDIALKALNLSKEHPVSRVFTATEIIKNNHLFDDCFNRTYIYATYQAAAQSFLYKMLDNLYQLGIEHPFQMSSAVMNKDFGRFAYHILGVFHALLSLFIDPLVELLSVTTRSIKTITIKPQSPQELFPETSRAFDV